MTPPPTTPIAALPPHDDDTHEKSGGSGRGVAVRPYGTANGRDRRAMESTLRLFGSSSPLERTGRCIAASGLYNLEDRGCLVITISYTPIGPERLATALEACEGKGDEDDGGGRLVAGEGKPSLEAIGNGVGKLGGEGGKDGASISW
jgi:hypothetical protein